VITVFAHNRVNDHTVTDKAFGDDARWKRCGLCALFFATTAGALLSLGYKHEVLGGFDVQLFAGLVANQLLILSPLGTDALSGVQAIIFSTRGKWAGNSCRPGCLAG
jgi:hypothetical protein